jgi:hypothetical protein
VVKMAVQITGWNNCLAWNWPAGWLVHTFQPTLD